MNQNQPTINRLVMEVRAITDELSCALSAQIDTTTPEGSFGQTHVVFGLDEASYFESEVTTRDLNESRISVIERLMDYYSTGDRKKLLFSNCAFVVKGFLRYFHFILR